MKPSQDYFFKKATLVDYKAISKKQFGILKHNSRILPTNVISIVGKLTNAI